MTPAEALASIGLALPGWTVAFHSLTGELSARRGDVAVFGRSAGEVVDRVAGLLGRRVRVAEAK